MKRPTEVNGRREPLLALVPAEPRERPGALPEPHTHGVRERAERPDDTPSVRGLPAARRLQQAGLREELRERTADLQRLKAEYDNYRMRVRRDRQTVREIAVANVLSRLLPVLDALAGAAEQGEVTGGFEHVARALDAELGGLGLESVGRVGDRFDPAVHEAVSYRASDRIRRPTCTVVLRLGYRVGDHLLRPAQVEVTAPPAGP